MYMYNSILVYVRMYVIIIILTHGCSCIATVLY